MIRLFKFIADTRRELCNAHSVSSQQTMAEMVGGVALILALCVIVTLASAGVRI